MKINTEIKKILMKFIMSMININIIFMMIDTFINNDFF